MNNSTLVAPVTAAPEILDTYQTDCCIVGGGPAGAVLALLLARQGIKVILLEVHRDLDRDFRGDTIHPSTMEIMAELGRTRPHWRRTIQAGGRIFDRRQSLLPEIRSQ